ncbi:hypothetical protein [Halobacteriovorax sp. JY17]|uniref:hypothetical protein n=1 Tax=Halobacteriovorax sp. JY17 TaxID=2014617 RepID=UPI000C3EABE0|nr:hypothetical protein [Halobacteriovorax sp. JY17]PIK14825.1 MAG: hypothetical protein CES88_10845 [Halobacteriovorax sp. JY17]
MVYVKKITTFFLLSFFCLSPVFAQKYGKIFLNEDGIHLLNGQERNYVKKSVYEVVYYTGVFDLIIGKYKKSLSKEESFSIDININATSKDQQFANVKLGLREMKTNKPINIVESKKVPRIKLQYTVRKLLFKLFYEENYDEENDRVINNKVIPVTSQITHPSEPDSVSKDPEQETSEGSPVEGMEEAIVAEESANDPIEEEEEDKAKKVKKDKDKEVKISKFDSPDIDVTVEQEVKIFKPTSFEVHSKFYVNLGQSTDATESSTIIETRTDTKQLRFEIGSRFQIGDRSDYYDIGLSVGQLLGENKYQLSAGFKFHLEYALNLYKRNLYIIPSIEYETLSFADLSTKGDGIVPWNNKLMWFGAKGRVSLFNDRLEISGGYAKSFIGDSDLGKKSETFPIEGSKVMVGAMTKVYKKLGIGAAYNIVSLTSSASSSFKADYESFQVLLTYR